MASQNVTGMTVLATYGYRRALAGALPAPAAAEEHGDAAVVTLVVSASGVAPLGVSAPFWGLVAGLALMAVLHRRPA